MHFVTSQDELNSLPGETQFKLLKKGLPECIVMAKVWGFNNRSLEDELDLVLADNDLNMFRVRNISLSNKSEFSTDDINKVRHLRAFLASLVSYLTSVSSLYLYQIPSTFLT